MDDVTADMVITELNRRDTPVARFNPADIGAALTLSARFGSCPVPVAGQIRTPSRTVDLARVRSVYWRRPVWPAFDHLGADDARFAAAQARYGLGGTLYSLEGPLWVNHPLRNAAADYKPAQLAVAQRLGLTVPPTLVTNDPDEARSFIAHHDRVIFKTLRWTPYQRDGVAVTGWADPVAAPEIDESVALVPHLFQAVVDKVADIRVLVVGRAVFAVRIDSGMLDWRKDYSALSYRVVNLPEYVEKALLAYLDHFGLVSGSFDLAVDRADGLWWLELNPNGQWGWLEESTGLAMDAALETAGFSPWTVTGDGLLGHPRRAPYDRVVATCAVRRIPYAWIRQTTPGGIVLATVGGSWHYGTGLAKVTVAEDGSAGGRIIGRSSFMQARSQAEVPIAGDLSARTAYADSEREAKVSPLFMEEWMPAFLAQLAAPGASFTRATSMEGDRLLYLFDPERESFASFTENDGTWTVRQGGPVALWDGIEQALTAWLDADSPDITAVRLHITRDVHTYGVDGHPALRWQHRLV